MSRAIGNHHQKSVEQRLKLVDELINWHQRCGKQFTDYSSTVVRPFDNYLLLASHLCWELWHETNKDAHFWTAVLHLHQALTESPASYSLRFVLVKFLNQVGAVGASQHFHAGLEIKHIQLDSLGYLLTRHVQTCGHFHFSKSIFNATLKFFSANYKDVRKSTQACHIARDDENALFQIIDFLISAYRCGSFDKIVEFINLRNRLSSSQHYAHLSVEQPLLELLTEASSHEQAIQVIFLHRIYPEKDDISWPDLTDNRDFKVMTSWDPPEK